MYQLLFLKCTGINVCYYSIRRVKVENYWKLYFQDPFHTIVNMRLSKVLSLLVIGVRFIHVSMLYHIDTDDTECST